MNIATNSIKVLTLSNFFFVFCSYKKIYKMVPQFVKMVCTTWCLGAKGARSCAESLVKWRVVPENVVKDNLRVNMCFHNIQSLGGKMFPCQHLLGHTHIV